MDQILKASYGDRGQRQVNELPSDRARAAAIQQDFKAKKQAENKNPNKGGRIPLHVGRHKMISK